MRHCHARQATKPSQAHQASQSSQASKQHRWQDGGPTIRYNPRNLLEIILDRVIDMSYRDTYELSQRSLELFQLATENPATQTCLDIRSLVAENSRITGIPDSETQHVIWTVCKASTTHLEILLADDPEAYKY